MRSEPADRRYAALDVLYRKMSQAFRSWWCIRERAGSVSSRTDSRPNALARPFTLSRKTFLATPSLQCLLGAASPAPARLAWSQPWDARLPSRRGTGGFGCVASAGWAGPGPSTLCLPLKRQRLPAVRRLWSAAAALRSVAGWVGGAAETGASRMAAGTALPGRSRKRP